MLQYISETDILNSCVMISAGAEPQVVKKQTSTKYKMRSLKSHRSSKYRSRWPKIMIKSCSTNIIKIKKNSTKL